MSKRQKPETMDAVTVLQHIRDDVKAIDWKHLDDDGQTILIPKYEVLDVIQDWMEYCLNPNQTTLAKVE